MLGREAVRDLDWEGRVSNQRIGGELKTSNQETREDRSINEEWKKDADEEKDG